jgi:hypothetical protein
VLGLKTIKTSIYTDASNFACGVLIESEDINETVPWPEDDDIANATIFAKETFAVKYVLKVYGSRFKNSRILLYNDNQNLVNSFQHGTRDLYVNKMIKEIHMIALKHNIHADISWVPTTAMLADENSRTEDTREAILTTAAFQEVERKAQVKFSLDCFAIETNKKCECFITRQSSSLAWATDFFSVKSFGEHCLWVYPPLPITAPAFLHLMQAAKKNWWALLIVEFEVTSPIWPEIKGNPFFRKIELQTNPAVLYPTKQKGEHGYWRVPKRLTVSVLLHSPEKFKRSHELDRVTLSDT